MDIDRASDIEIHFYLNPDEQSKLEDLHLLCLLVDEDPSVCYQDLQEIRSKLLQSGKRLGLELDESLELDYPKFIHHYFNLICKQQKSYWGDYFQKELQDLIIRQIKSNEWITEAFLDRKRMKA